MKHRTKTTPYTLVTLCMIFTGFSAITKAEDHTFATPHPHATHTSKVITFTPDNAFGGVDAQGSYTIKGKTASITYDQTTYEFNHALENPNPDLYTRKRAKRVNQLKRVHLGFFSDHTNSKGMPVTTHLYGSPINDAALNAATTDKKVSQEAAASDFTSDKQQFKPAKKFSGHDLVGFYASDTHQAMIQDTTGKNKKSYRFSNVQEGSSTTNSGKKSVLIGSYNLPPQCSEGTPQVCSNAIRVINLYGELQQ